ncbi:MAG TPA: fluoride efflux transporter CrcB [Desulfobacterales bacterium]|jgi:fluoride exporter|nr:fluoride efflux transporter CrcB [Desulfobacterales bacterium]
MGGWLELLIALNAAVTDVFFAMAEDGRRSLLLLKMPALVMCGGSLGAASRYGIGLLAVRIWGAGFPWGTLIVNLVGCFFIGLVFGLGDSVRFLTPEMRLLLVTGYLGALTTFSTFCLETVAAARAGLRLQPLTNILINNAGGLALTFLGIWLGGLG